MSSQKTKLSKERKAIAKWWNTITPLQLQKIALQANADGYNAGYGKIARRVIFCKDAGEFVIQQKVENKWLCLHE